MATMNQRIALVITDQETNAQIKHLGVGLLELRVDLFKALDEAYILAQIQKRRMLGIPLLLTLRNQRQEGAVKIFSDQQKWQIIRAVLPFVDMIDIELSSLLLKQIVMRARSLKVKVIVSSHYLDSMPRDLEAVFKKSLRVKADIVKIAAKAACFEDVMTMLQFTLRHRDYPLITMSLGSLGCVSRLILPMAGSLYTYSFLSTPKASGQVDVKTLIADFKTYYSPSHDA